MWFLVFCLWLFYFDPPARELILVVGWCWYEVDKVERSLVSRSYAATFAPSKGPSISCLMR